LLPAVFYVFEGNVRRHPGGNCTDALQKGVFISKRLAGKAEEDKQGIDGNPARAVVIKGKVELGLLARYGEAVHPPQPTKR
jgi:hypothetical protein